MIKLFLLTAPFDEAAKTGDGQYAATLEKSFADGYAHAVKCVWLKEAEHHYTVPCPEGTRSIPAKTIPSTYVLQRIANENTVVSGYQLLTSDKSAFAAAQDINARTVSPRSPKVILNQDGHLMALTIMNHHQSTPVVLAVDDVARLIDKLSKPRVNPVDISKKERTELSQKIKAAKLLFAELGACFHALFNVNQLIHISDKLTGVKKEVYDFSIDDISLRPSTKLSASEGFRLAHEASRHDPLKRQLIDGLIQTMRPMADDSDTYLDVHIRPPDCGAFISSDDIGAFQNAGIRVNLTIHEYIQNYTRRYLQQYTHDLMRKADSVQFFNQRDCDDAVLAATHGDCDQRNTATESGIRKKMMQVGESAQLEAFVIEPYALEVKSGLSVASQTLSDEPPHPEDILRKPANFLSFGTIRPGKGFEEALELAQSVKAKENLITQKIKHAPMILVAGDPQDHKLMRNLANERFGEERVKRYQDAHPCLPNLNADERRTYWKELVSALNSYSLHNEHLEIHPWCEKNELLALKKRSKYVCRMDDMGMRNNASAIISVLDVGIVYAKFGAATDDMYNPKKHGQYANAVDIGQDRYGKYNLYKQENVHDWLSHNPDYQRKSGSRDADEHS